MTNLTSCNSFTSASGLPSQLVDARPRESCIRQKAGLRKTRAYASRASIAEMGWGRQSVARGLWRGTRWIGVHNVRAQKKTAIRRSRLLFLLLKSQERWGGAKRVLPHRRWLHLLDAIHKCFQLAAARRMTQLAQRLGFDLANALAR